MEHEGYSLFEIRDKLKITQYKLQEWVGMGFINPGIHRATGPGDKNRFDRNNLYQIFLFQQLRRLGLKREAVANLLLGNIDFSDLKERGMFYHITPGRGTSWTGDMSHGPMRLTSEDFIGMTVNLKAITREVDKLLP